jgi:hypothetical protein
MPDQKVPPRLKQIWVVKYKYKGRTHKATTPLFKYRWECAMWLHNSKPLAEILEITTFTQGRAP